MIKRTITLALLPLCLALAFTLVFLWGCKKEELPGLNTLELSEITASTAWSGGDIFSDGGAEILARGIVWDTAENPTLEQHAGITYDGRGTGVFTSRLTDLSHSTVYFVRAYARNNAGLVYGNQLQFSSAFAATPGLSTMLPVNIGQTRATTGGIISSEGGAPVLSRGVVYSTSAGPTIDDLSMAAGSGSGPFWTNLSGLSPGTTYYVRAYAENNAGLAYGEQYAFTTLEAGGMAEQGTFTDARDGQEYKWVRIGEQVWMAENLNFASEQSWCYENNPENCTHYGRLYTWLTVMNGESATFDNPSGVQGICPPGWHVPSQDEWDQMISHLIELGFPNDAHADIPHGAGNALRSCRQLNSPLGDECRVYEHPRWNAQEPNFGFDAFGFSALPAGARQDDGSFSSRGTFAYWWTSSVFENLEPRLMSILFWNSYVGGYSRYNGALSLRCVQD